MKRFEFKGRVGKMEVSITVNAESVCDAERMVREYDHAALADLPMTCTELPPPPQWAYAPNTDARVAEGLPPIPHAALALSGPTTRRLFRIPIVEVG